MTIAIANVQLANTFGHWIARTNELANAMSTSVLTVNSNTTVGNCSLEGTFSANTLSVQTLTGPGNVLFTAANLTIDGTASVTAIGTIHVQGTLLIDTVSKIQIPGSANNVNFLVANTSTGNLYFAEVLIPIGQLTNVTDTAANTKTNQSILMWNPNTSVWSVNTLAQIYQTNIANLSVGYISSVLTVSNTAAITNTMFVTAGKVGVGTATPRTALDVSGVIWATGDVSGFQTSDEKQKEHIVTLSGKESYLKLKESRPVEFDWTTENISVYRHPMKQGHDAGVIAQEWEKIFPNQVFTRPDGSKSVDYSKAVPYLIAAVKYLGEQLEAK